MESTRAMWLLSKIRLFSQSWWITSSDDTFLCAFPKSGGTWVRFFLFNLLNNLDNIESTPTFESMDKHMPEYGHDSIRYPWRYKSTHRIIKNHKEANFLTKGYKTVLLVRDPRNVAVSYYWYANAHRKLSSLSSLSEAIKNPRYGLEAAISHYNSWKSEAGLILRYEKLRQDPVAEFHKLCDFLDLGATPNLIRTTLDASSKNAMQAAQRDSAKMTEDFDNGYHFARKSSPEEWAQLRTDADEELWLKLKQRYGYDLYT